MARCGYNLGDEPERVKNGLPNKLKTISMTNEVSNFALSSSSSSSSLKPLPQRGLWRSRREFLLTSIGACVGLGNLWRFPYVAKENGGSTFIIAYLVLTPLFGMPLCLLESVLGQYSGLGALGIWKCCPAFKGIGLTNLLTLTLTMPVYTVVATYSVFYMVTAFSSGLPWTTHDENQWWLNKNDLNSVKLVNGSGYCMGHVQNESSTVCTFASQQYWENYVLNLHSADGISNIGTFRWPIVLCLLFCWVTVFLCLVKGIKSTGRVVFFTAVFPYVMLVTMLIRGATMEGGLDGIVYFFTPDWNGLLSIKVWKNAAQQFLISMGLATGSKATFASYNVFHHKVHIDAWITWGLDFTASILASMIAFAMLGAMAKTANTTIDNLPVAAQGLAFVVYPEVAATMFIPQLWLFLFFFMLFILRIDNQFCMVHVVYTAIQDELPRLRQHKTLCYFILCCLLFLIGLPVTTDGGQYVIRWIDVYTSGWIVFLVAFLEVTTVIWIYGLTKFCKDVQFMLGIEPCIIFKLSWAAGAPFIIISILVLYCINFPDAVYENYTYPSWAQTLGWVLAGICLLPIPTLAFVTVVKAWNDGDAMAAFRPTPEWGPNSNVPGYWPTTTKKNDFQSNETIVTHL